MPFQRSILSTSCFLRSSRLAAGSPQEGNSNRSAKSDGSSDSSGGPSNLDPRTKLWGWGICAVSLRWALSHDGMWLYEAHKAPNPSPELFSVRWWSFCSLLVGRHLAVIHRPDPNSEASHP